MNKSSEGLVEEAVSMVERLGELLKGILGVKKEEVPAGAAEIIEVAEAPVTEAPVKEETVESNGQAKASKSDLVREFLKKHGTEVRNKDVVRHVKKTKGLDVRPTLVSSVRAILKRKGIKTNRIKKFVMKKTKTGKGPTMPAAVIDTLKKAGKGLELSEITQKVLKSGYEYKGSKGIKGVTQNVFQALHNLSKRIAHPGFKGNTPVVIHEKTPGHRVGRYKLNPKAKVA